MTKFSQPIEKILLDSGWTSDREIDTSHFKNIAIQEGYDWFPSVSAFLSEFGNLRIDFVSRNGNKDTMHFDMVKACQDVDNSWVLDDYAKRVGSSKLCVVGQVHTDHMTLFMSDVGAVFGGFDDTLVFFGETGGQAIENICNLEFAGIP